MFLNIIKSVALIFTLLTLTSSAIAEKKVVTNSTSDQVNLSSAQLGVFFQKVHQSCKSKKSETWKPLLAKERREKGIDYIKQHYKIWCSFIIPLVQNKFAGDAASPKMKFKLQLDPESRQGKMTLSDENGKKLLPMTITIEGNEFKIDEN